MLEIAILVISICLALAYSYANGINDAANAIATVVSTRVLTPTMAIGMAAVLNLAGGLTGTAVAKTIGKGIIDPSAAGITQFTVLAAILAAVVWVLVATRSGQPVSVSHSLVAGLVGAGLASGGVGALVGSGLFKVLLALAFSPILGFLVGILAMWTIYWLFRRSTAGLVNKLFGKLQILSAAFMAYSHGKNDAQNAIGVIALAWAVYYGQTVEVELWMPILAAGTISLGTALGGWKVIRTLGMRVTHLEPVHGFAAETAAGAVIEAASSIGLPVSTTHTISTAIMGVGATRRVSAVRWGVTKDIVTAWLVTYPFCFAVGWVISRLLGIAF